MYAGLVELARRSGEVKQVWADVVYQAEVKADRFSYRMGADPHLEHKPIRGATRPDDSEIVFAYACARWKDGHVDFFVCDRAEIESARRMSMTPDGAWKTHFPAQAKKTAVKRLSKLLPMPDEAIQFLVEEEQREVDVEGEVVSGSTSVSSIDELLDARKSEKEEQSEQGFADEPQQSDEPAIRDIHGIPVDIKWEDVKDEEFGGGNKLLGHLTPAKLADLLGKDKEVTDAAKAVLKKGQAIYANGGTPPKPYRALALAFQQAENGAGF